MGFGASRGLFMGYGQNMLKQTFIIEIVFVTRMSCSLTSVIVTKFKYVTHSSNERNRYEINLEDDK